MFFLVSNFLALFVRPSALIVLLLVAGLVARAFGRGRVVVWGGRSVTAGLALVLFVLATPFGGFLVWGLEQRFPSAVAANDPAPAGIVLLGGGTDGAIEAVHRMPHFLDGGAAIFEAVRLAKRWPEVPVVLTGSGSGGIGDDGTDYTEAGTMARLMIEAGIDPGRLVLERRARTTWENALFSREMVRPDKGQRWVLVTTARHMPRSIGAFRAAGWDGIVAHPGDHEIGERPRLRPGLANGLRLAEIGVKEVVGLIGYRLTGRSSAFWPGP